MSIAIGVVAVAGVLVAATLLLRERRVRLPTAGKESPVVTVNPKDLLFSLPTLADRLPDGEKAEPVPGSAFHLHEDDWRQVEFASLVQQDEVEAELSQLRGFMSQHRRGVGFTEVYVRRSRPAGLFPLQIESRALDALLPRTAARRPLVVGTAPWGPTLVSGYAVEIGPNAILYVEVVRGNVTTIGLPLAWRRGASPSADALLAAIGRALKLRLVDWPAADWVRLE